MTHPPVRCCLILLAIVSFTRPAFAQAAGYTRETGIAYRSGEVADEAVKSRCLIDIHHPADRKVAGHKDCTLHELGGFDHGGIFEPSFHLLLEFTNRVTKSPSNP